MKKIELKIPVFDTQRIYTVLFVVLFCYLLIGVFPFEYFESDALGIVSGSKEIIRSGTFSENLFTYNFPVQVGTYFWVILLHQLSGLDLKACSSIASAGFGILYFLGAALFVSRITKESFAKCGLVLLLFQETYSSWYYMNAATGAAFFMIWGLLAATKKPSLVSITTASLLLSLAVWTKLDVVLVLPVVFFIVEAASVRERVSFSGLLALAVLLLTLGMYYLSDVRNFSEVFEGRGGSLSFSENTKTVVTVWFSQFLRAIVGYFSVLLLIVIPIGFAALIQKKGVENAGYLSYSDFFLSGSY